jgi:HD-GYP domain-containing protein (c-di-GMP phosphodiesterase class II)
MSCGARLTHDQALAQLKKDAGVKWDAKVVEALAGLQTELLTIN